MLVRAAFTEPHDILESPVSGGSSKRIASHVMVPKCKSTGCVWIDLPFAFDDQDVTATWVKVLDKLSRGEMPPKGQPRPPERRGGTRRSLGCIGSCTTPPSTASTSRVASCSGD